MSSNRKPIDIAIAKEQLVRVNEILSAPVLLIGGLAVQQYDVVRKSKDLDIVCDHEIARTIIKDLYPDDEWKVVDINDDEYRPSFQITHRTKNYGEISIGPKISEREPYRYIDWSMVASDAKPFKYKNNKLTNILVPKASILAFTKLLSFVERKEKNKAKAIQDLNDFVALSNNDEFSLISFMSAVSSAKALTFLKDALKFTDGDDVDIFKRSSVYKTLDLFGEALHTEHISAPISAPHDMPAIEEEIVKIAFKHQGKNTLMHTGAKELLIVVDIQNDFFKGGALAAHDSESLISPLNELIRRAELGGFQIVFTRDWHPPDHSSFSDWGVHCQKESDGAKFHPNLYRPDSSVVIDIGSDIEMDSYSPFDDPRLRSLLSNDGIRTIYVVGIALEFCVLATCRDAVWFNKNVIAVEPYIRSVYEDPQKQEVTWQLLTSLGVIRAKNVVISTATA